MGPGRQGTQRGRRAVRPLLALLVVGAILVGGVAVLWNLQRQLIYFPDASPVPPAGEAIDGARTVGLETADGLDLEAWFVPPPTDGRARGMAVLIAPGNGGNRLGRAGIAEDLRAVGFAVLLLDYRGYGGNPGSPSEEGLAADADAAVTALTGLGYPPERTLYLGESLGTGVVAALQARTPPAGVVLRSPFPDLASVGAHVYPWLPVRLLLRDRFPVTEHLRGSSVPVTVIHGTADAVVPSGLSAEVARTVPVLVEEVVLPGVGHNDPQMYGAPVVAAVTRLADRVA
ncbi:alpha/beta hydrolase [Nocardioides insulae]|uniref:alpha/beta hydrolase n=1 Tax=Nocardioides insulae TaxID=394734 RepID=UPI0004063CA7|nr:alpha/beta fold hydrolase [Nocardioides insulae]